VPYKESKKEDDYLIFKSFLKHQIEKTKKHRASVLSGVHQLRMHIDFHSIQMFVFLKIPQNKMSNKSFLVKVVSYFINCNCTSFQLNNCPLPATK